MEQERISKALRKIVSIGPTMPNFTEAMDHRNTFDLEWPHLLETGTDIALIHKLLRHEKTEATLFTEPFEGIGPAHERGIEAVEKPLG